MRRFGCFFVHPILDIISRFGGIKYDSHCFTFSAQLHLKQVSSTSNLGCIDYYVSASSIRNLSLIKELSKSTSSNKLSVDFQKTFFNVESTKDEQMFSRTKRNICCNRLERAQTGWSLVSAVTQPGLCVSIAFFATSIQCFYILYVATLHK